MIAALNHGTVGARHTAGARKPTTEFTARVRPRDAKRRRSVVAEQVTVVPATHRTPVPTLDGHSVGGRQVAPVNNCGRLAANRGAEQKRERPARALAVDVAQALFDQPVDVRQPTTEQAVPASPRRSTTSRRRCNPAGATYELSLGEGRVSARADCNVCNGALVLSGQTATIGPILACTRAACATMAFETTYVAVLAGDSVVRIDGVTLTLTSSRGTLRFLQRR